MQSSTAQYLNSRAGDPGEVTLEGATPMANTNAAERNRAASPTSPDRNDLVSPNFAPRGQAEVAPDVEEAPLVKHHGAPSASPMKGGSKPVTLTFQDLKYSVRVKNPNKQAPSDPKCKFYLDWRPN